MAKIDITYQQLLKDILSRGYTYDDPNRKGVKRKQLSDYTIKHNLFKDGFPVLTLRKIHYNGAFGEFVSFMNNVNTTQGLAKNKVNFWFKDGFNFFKKNNPKSTMLFDEFKTKDYTLGKIYPYQMRSWNGNIDQINDLVKTLKKNPMATKKTVTMWNPSDLDDTALSPCHWSFEVLTEPLTISQREETLKKVDMDIYEDYVVTTKYNERESQLDTIGVPKYGMSIKWHQHSVDVFLGLPTNIVYYSLMCIVLANEVDMLPMGIIGDLSNVHIYDNAIKPSYELLKRNPNEFSSPYFRYRGSLKELELDCFDLLEYKSFDNITVEMLPYGK